MAGGYIKLYRKIREHWVWQDSEYLKWWLDILLLVNHEPKKIPINGKLKVMDIGEHHTSILKLSERWFVNPKTVTKFLKMLEKDEMISVTKNRQDGTTLKVLNYKNYQAFFDSDLDNEKDNGGTTVRISKGEQNGYKQEPKNLEEPENYIGADAPIVQVPYKQIVELYNNLCSSLPKVREITKSRVKTIRARYSEFNSDLAKFSILFSKAESSDFLAGRKENSAFTASFDWILAPKNYPKILEGNYDNRSNGAFTYGNGNNGDKDGDSL